MFKKILYIIVGLILLAIIVSLYLYYPRAWSKDLDGPYKTVKYKEIPFVVKVADAQGYSLISRHDGRKIPGSHIEFDGGIITGMTTIVHSYGGSLTPSPSEVESVAASNDQFEEVFQYQPIEDKFNHELNDVFLYRTEHHEAEFFIGIQTVDGTSNGSPKNVVFFTRDEGFVHSGDFGLDELEGAIGQPIQPTKEVFAAVSSVMKEHIVDIKNHF